MKLLLMKLCSASILVKALSFKIILMTVYVSLLINSLLWSFHFFCWLSPTEFLNENNMGDIFVYDLVLTFLFGIPFSIFVFFTRHKYKNRRLYVFNQMLSVAVYGIYIVLVAIAVMFIGLGGVLSA